MIIKSFEISKINFNKNNFYLLYGENEGYKNEVIKKYFEKIYPNSIYRHDENQILDDKDKFLNGLISKSFFDIKKLIIISRVSDKIVDLIEEIISRNIMLFFQFKILPIIMDISYLSQVWQSIGDYAVMNC